MSKEPIFYRTARLLISNFICKWGYGIVPQIFGQTFFVYEWD